LEELALGQLRLKVKYFYSLTYREFVNTVNGFQKYEDIKSREQWSMTRKMMYASVAPYADENFKETDFFKFPGEEEMLKKIAEKQLLVDLERERISKEFFAKYDAKKAAMGKA